MHALGISEIEAVAAGSPEKWWFKPPQAGDSERIGQFVEGLSVSDLKRYYDLHTQKTYNRVNNRFYLFLCSVVKRYETHQGLIED